MHQFQLAIVDDDSLVFEAIKSAAPQHWKIQYSNDWKKIPQGPFHAAMVDMHLTGDLTKTEGLKVINKLIQTKSPVEIIAMSGDLNQSLMEDCLKAGASRFLAKPLSPDEVRLTLQKIEAYFLLQQTIERNRSHSIHWIGQGKASTAVKKQLSQLRGEFSPILIEGETGSGKEVCAHLIHQQDPHRPFVAVNVAAIPENLFESELFGHLRGSFTGADQNKMGLAEAAADGDLFLDEIEALPLHLQAKLLRFIETGEIRRVGSKEPIFIRCRVIAASNRNLQAMVKENQFREDLLWRLSGNKVQLPPLRKRSEDVPQLFQYFMEKDKIRKKEISSEAMNYLKEYHWPGNVRELKRICEQMLIRCPLPVVRLEDVIQLLQPTSIPTNLNSFDFGAGLHRLVGEFEGSVIAKCLEQYNDVDKVANTLQISRSSLYKKIKDYDINWRH